MSLESIESKIDKSIRPISKIGCGRKVVTAAGTREPLVDVSTPCICAIITGETDNTNIVTAGDATVIGALLTRTGTPLSASQTLVLDIDNLNKIYLDCITNGEGVTYTYLA